MSRQSEHGLDVRVWLVWGLAIMIPLLTGRHPVVIATLLAIVLVVRSVCLQREKSTSWSWLVRISMIAVPIGMLFNMLTVHAGDRRMFHISDDVPIIGGDITWNALVYGLLSGITIVVLVATGTTVAAALDWNELMRHTPARAANVAVAGSVAWTFLPQLSKSWHEIREAQTARGHQWRGVRDAVPLLVPLMAGGLDRSITMAEALESRGFGAQEAVAKPHVRSSVALAVAMTTAVASLYLFAVGSSGQAAVVLLLTVLFGVFGVRSGSSSPAHRMTSYRRRKWTGRDTVTLAGASVAIVAIALFLQISPESLRYEPYPTMEWPVASPVLVLALGALMLPAAVAPASPDLPEVNA